MDDVHFVANPSENQELMRWRAPENRLELWTGERWVDLERDVLQLLAGFVNRSLPGGELTANDWDIGN